MSKTVLHIWHTCPSFKNAGISKGFNANGWETIDIDWMHFKMTIGVERMREHILREVKTLQPDLVFAQVQINGVFTIEFVQECMKVCPMVLFNIDARLPEQFRWFYELTGYVTHSFVSNGNDVKELAKLGFNNSSVLPSAVDSDEYYELATDSSLGIRPIAFIANKHSNFPNSQQRIDLVSALTEAFPNDFSVYGMGWGSDGFVGVEKEREIYSNTRLAIIHNNFDYEDYESDRLYRAWACGCQTARYSTGVSLEEFIERVGYFLDYTKKNEKSDYSILGNSIYYPSRVVEIEETLAERYGLVF